MKNLKLLSNKFFFFILIFVFSYNELYSDETVDIWNLEKKENDKVFSQNSLDENTSLQKSLYDKIQNKDNQELPILDNDQLENNILLAGLYDPQENNLNIDMWTNSDGEKIRLLLNKINNLNLSDDANNILEIVLLTNSYFPKENIKSDEFRK